MTILAGDIQFLTSQVLDDVPEGGGAITGTVLPDGGSTLLFGNKSEIDTVYGRVKLRKIALAVRTATNDKYSGAHIVLGAIPADPLVSCVLFSTGSGFDRRDAAQSRIESYLTPGPSVAGYFFENHVAGQRAIRLCQRVGAALPGVGVTLYLSAGGASQYVRITGQASEIRTFAYSGVSGIIEYTRQIATLSISDALRYDFAGTAANPTDMIGPGATVVHETIVADAAKYYGGAPLVAAAAMGDLSIRVGSLFSPLVPSAQTNVPIADATPSGAIIALQPSTPGTLSINGSGRSIGPTTPVFIGCMVLPGSLSIPVGSETWTDQGGSLMRAGANIGTVDYQAGVIRVAAGGPSGALGTLTYRPAASPATVTASQAIAVTAETRSSTIVITLDPVPARATLSIAYMAQGKWYSLTEDGGGRISGSDSSYGGGTLSYSTGTVLATFGALPDVGSYILVTWGDVAPAAGLQASQTTQAFFEYMAPQPIHPSSLLITWSIGAANYSATDDGKGALIGAAVGSVDYLAGRVRISPSPLPAPGSVFGLSASGSDTTHFLGDGASAGGAWNYSVTGPIAPGSLSGRISVTRSAGSYYGDSSDSTAPYVLTDDGLGQLLIGSTVAGSVNYVTGDISIHQTLSAVVVAQNVVLSYQDQTLNGQA